MNNASTLVAFARLSAMAAFTLALGANVSAASDVPEGADAALHAKVPAEYRNGVKAVYDPQYPPLYYVDEAGDVVGYVIDVQNEIARRLGITISVDSAKFSGIIPGLQGKRYDMSYFQDSDERRQQMDMVAVQKTGTGILVQKGNPNGLEFDDLCGHKVGVQSGSRQSDELMPRLQDACKANGGDAIEVLNFAGPNEGSLAVKTGRLDGWMDSAPYIGYLVKQSPDTFEMAPGADLTGVSAFAFRKGDPIAGLFRDAANAMVADGSYANILEEWKITELGVESVLFNGQ